MAIDIGIKHADGTVEYLQTLDVVFYHALSPWFNRLAEQTGQQIDLYGDALFHAGSCPLVRAMIREARTAVQRYPAQWMVHLGTQTHPERREIYAQVEQKALLAWFSSMLMLLELVEESGAKLIFSGD